MAASVASEALTDLAAAMAALDDDAGTVEQPAAPSARLGGAAAASPPQARLGLLHQMTAEIAALDARNASLAEDIESLSCGSSLAPSPARRERGGGPSTAPPPPPKHGASHTAAPPTPDLSQV